jgi:hypothetical protein
VIWLLWSPSPTSLGPSLPGCCARIMGSHSHSNRLVVYCREACSRALLIAPVLSQFSVDQFESPWCSLVFADEFIPCTWQDSGAGCRNLLAPLLLFHMRRQDGLTEERKHTSVTWKGSKLSWVSEQGDKPWTQVSAASICNTDLVTQKGSTQWELGILTLKDLHQAVRDQAQ